MNLMTNIRMENIKHQKVDSISSSITLYEPLKTYWTPWNVILKLYNAGKIVTKQSALLTSIIAIATKHSKVA